MRRLAVGLAALLCLCGAFCGCSSSALKGTPFYTGPRQEVQGKQPDRINLWPLVYYQYPELSVLWPLGHFDLSAHVHHFFPVYWGTPAGEPAYFNVLPLVWYEAGNYAGIVPFFIRYIRPGGQSVHVLWPIVNWKTGEGETGWRVWPLFGHYSDDSSSHTYALWPLLMYLRDGTDVLRWALPFYIGQSLPGDSWDAVIPFFFRRVAESGRQLAVLPFFLDSRGNDGAHTFISPLYMMGRDGEAGWDLVVPVYFHSTGPEGGRTAVFPFFYRRADASGGWTFVSPVYSGGRGPQTAWDLGLPLYFRYSSPKGSSTVVLPAYYSSEQGAVRQRLLFPLFYTWTDGDASLLLTLPFGLHHSGQATTAYAFPLLSAYKNGTQGKELWALFPLSHWRWNNGLEESHVFPLYYWDRQKDTFISLPYARWQSGGTRYSTVLGPLFERSATADSHQTGVLWPLTSFWKDSQGAGSYVFPFYIYARNGDGKSLNLGLLLGQFDWTPRHKDFWLLAGLAGGLREENRARSYFWPFYRYQRAAKDTQLDLGPYLPNPFSSDDPEPTYSLAGYRRAGDDSQHHFLPFWYWRKAGDWLHLNIGLLLADYERTADGKDLNLLWPIFSRWSGSSGAGHHVWPLYSYDHDGNSTTLKVGPFVGPVSLAGTTRDAVGSLTWAFPVFLSHSRGSSYWYEAGSTHSVTTSEQSFTVFPLVWQASSTPLTEARIPNPSAGDEGDTPRPKPHGHLTVLPLFGSRYEGDLAAPDGTAESNFWLLGWLYDSKTRVTAAAKGAQKSDVYVRRRILWRAMNYERTNDTTSLDVFPGITVDKTPGRKKTVSFLWRVFRYEWDKDTGTKLHILFIPFGGGGTPAEQPKPGHVGVERAAAGAEQ